MYRPIAHLLLAGLLAPAVAVAGPLEPVEKPAEDAIEARTRALEARVAELREQVFRSKARLATLQEMVVGGDLTAGSKAIVLHRNEMGASYVLESATFALDGAPVFTRTDEGGELDRSAQLDVFDGRVAPGPHQLAVKLVYRARGSGLLGARDGDRLTLEFL